MESTRTLRIALELLTTKTRVIITGESGNTLFVGNVVDALRESNGLLSHEVDKMHVTSSGLLQIELNE